MFYFTSVGSNGLMDHFFDHVDRSILVQLRIISTKYCCHKCFTWIGKKLEMVTLFRKCYFKIIVHYTDIVKDIFLAVTVCNVLNSDLLSLFFMNNDSALLLAILVASIASLVCSELANIGIATLQPDFINGDWKSKLLVVCQTPLMPAFMHYRHYRNSVEENSILDRLNQSDEQALTRIRKKQIRLKTCIAEIRDGIHQIVVRTLSRF
jgi:hypothetical protein